MRAPVTVITCPYCKKEIPLDEALTHQIREKLQTELQKEIQEREQELLAKENAIALKEKELQKLKKQQEEELEKIKIELAKGYNTKLKAELEKADEVARKKAEEKISLELKDLHQQLEERNKMVQQFRDAELTLRKEKRKLEEDKQNQELEVARKIDEEKGKIREEITKTITEQHKMKDHEKDKLIGDMKDQIEDLKRRAELGSQQLQGEVQELELEDLLREHFIHDAIEPVTKGKRGADVIQKVLTPSGHPCGSIIWESKRTKNWSDGWIDKLKEDQRSAKADIAVIISEVLPKEVGTISQVKGVWITNFTLAAGLASALRSGLIQIALAKQSMVGKNEKMEMLYEYLAGPEFRQQIEGIVEAFSSMKSDLDTEKRAMEKIWAKRDKQIERVIKNTGRMYGNLQGIIGSSLPELKSLELKALAGGEE